MLCCVVLRCFACRISKVLEGAVAVWAAACSFCSFAVCCVASCGAVLRCVALFCVVLRCVALCSVGCVALFCVGLRAAYLK